MRDHSSISIHAVIKGEPYVLQEFWNKGTMNGNQIFNHDNIISFDQKDWNTEYCGESRKTFNINICLNVIKNGIIKISYDTILMYHITFWNIVTSEYKLKVTIYYYHEESQFCGYSEHFNGNIIKNNHYIYPDKIEPIFRLYANICGKIDIYD